MRKSLLSRSHSFCLCLSLCGLLLACLGACSVAQEDLGPDAGSAEKSDCIPTVCAPSTCGVISDGCGSSVDCGSCDETPDETCTPISCGADDCGVTADGCGGTVDCGSCSGNCENDDLVGNDTDVNAFYLGSYADGSGQLSNLVIAPGESDWFAMGVTDPIGISNPVPSIGINGLAALGDIEVAVRFDCNVGGATFECSGGSYDGPSDSCVMTVAAGSTQWLSLTSLNCTGALVQENGTAVVEVKSAGGACSQYELLHDVQK